MSGETEEDIENPNNWVERNKSKSRLDVAFVNQCYAVCLLVGNETFTISCAFQER